MLIDGVDLKTLGFTVLKDYEDDLFPPISYNPITIPGRAGKRKGEVAMAEKIRVYDIMIKGESEADLEHKLNLFKKLFLDQKGELKPVTVVPYDDGLYFTAYINGTSSVKRSFRTYTITVELVSFEPYKYGEVSHASGSVFPMTIMADDHMQAAAATYHVSFLSSTSHFRLEHVGLGKKIELQHHFSEGSLLSIQMYMEKITSHGEDLRAKLTFESDFFNLVPGENVLDTNADIGLSLWYVPRFL